MCRHSKALNTQHQGFTLIEILVVIAIIGILASVVLFNTSGTSAKSRDDQRQADLRALQSAIETYKNREGHYPAGCNTAGNWSGQVGSGFACPGGSTQYITDLAPEYISVLPVDPKVGTAAGGSGYGYMYVTNAEGTVYKIMAMNSVEADTSLSTLEGYKNPFKSCDIKPRINAAGEADALETGNSMCYNAFDAQEGNRVTLTRCSREDPNDLRFSKSYGLWGGYAEPNSSYRGVDVSFPLNLPPAQYNNKLKALFNTTNIICK